MKDKIEVMDIAVRGRRIIPLDGHGNEVPFGQRPAWLVIKREDHQDATNSRGEPIGVELGDFFDERERASMAVLHSKFEARLMMVRDVGKLIIPTPEELTGLSLLELDGENPKPKGQRK